MDYVYPSEEELNEVEAKLLAAGMPIHALEAQIEGTYSFMSVQSPEYVLGCIQRAGFLLRNRVFVQGTAMTHEYTIAPATAEPAQPAAPATATGGEGGVVWKPVLNYEQQYRVSSAGGIQNINTGKILKPRLMPNGYNSVCLSKDGKTTRYTLHRLVCEAFLGKRPFGNEINHLDGDKINNNLSNLEYVTPKENMHHAFQTLKIQHARGERVATAKLTETDVLAIIELLKRECSVGKIAESYGVSRRAIRDIKNGKNWKHLIGSTGNIVVEDQIEVLQKRVAQLESALEPFAAMGAEVLRVREMQGDRLMHNAVITYEFQDTHITLGDWRKAIEARQQAGEGEVK